MSAQPIIFVLNGPNLNLLGEREPEVYGGESLEDIRSACARAAANAGFDLDFRQSNHEGDLVGWIHEARDAAAGVAINAGGYTHSSVAIHDALRLLEVPVIEVHLSNVFGREAYRHHSYVAPAATGVICGLGADGYVLAIEALARRIKPGP